MVPTNQCSIETRQVLWFRTILVLRFQNRPVLFLAFLPFRLFHSRIDHKCEPDNAVSSSPIETGWRTHLSRLFAFQWPCTCDLDRVKSAKTTMYAMSRLDCPWVRHRMRFDYQSLDAIDCRNAQVAQKSKSTGKIVAGPNETCA